MNSLLRDVVQRGTATRAKVLNRQDLAGKTGTTNDHRDAWFNGYTPSIVATAWVGFDNYSPLGNRETGGTTALPMWIEFMQTALKNTPESPFDAPEGIVKAFINPQTGLLASEESQNGVWEFFQAEQVPNKSSSVFEDFPAEYGEPNEKPIEILF
jgi:penicillin-binding protein 1A